MLQLSDIVHRYGERAVLDGVSLQVGPGECVAVLGLNGSGKSTLLRLAAGRERPDAGEVLLDGAATTEDDVRRRAAVATALDRVACYPDLTVREHLMLVALAHGADDRARAVVDRALAGHRLAGHADAHPDRLSSGQRQLLALAALEVRPYVLAILDEPEQHLDRAARGELAARLRESTAGGAAVLLATHDRELAQRAAARCHTLVDGRLADDGPPDAC